MQINHVHQTLREHLLAEVEDSQRTIERIAFSMRLDSYIRQGLLTREEADRMRDIQKFIRN